MADVKELNINNTTYDIKAKSVADTNSGKLKFWSGTRQEYDAIVTKDANTLYNITDDTDVTLSLLELLYPVGAIYIGTMSTCPLAVLGIGTWVLKATDRVLQGAGTRGSVGTTVNESLPNITGSYLSDLGDSSKYPTLQFNKSATTSGAITARTNVNTYCPSAGASSTNQNSSGFYLDASRSSSTYQNDAPVQQDAYLVNIWERIS